ncbi:MAG: cytochrome c oxidase subunit II [Acidimicrobiales bacterium]
MRRRRALGLCAAAGLFVTACAAHAPQDTLKPKGPEARYIDARFYPVFWIAVGMFCLVMGIAVYTIVRYRERPGGDAPKQIHGSTKLEITWTVIPFLLLVGVGILSVVGVFHLYENPSGPRITMEALSASDTPLTGHVLEVHVIGHRWWWEFDYPGLGTGFDNLEHKPGMSLVTAGELHIPAGVMVRLDITSNEPLASPEGRGPGVMHNFWVPALGGKIYAIPGHLTHLNIEADSKQITDGHPIVYFGQCSEYCGLSHANMRFKVVADSPKDFAQWVAAQGQSAAALTASDQFTSPLAYAGYQLFNGTAGCATCHTVSGTPAAGQVGPNLTHLQERSVFAGAIFALNDTNLRTWLRDPQGAKPGANMRIRKLNEDEITKLIAYLDTLK